MKFYKLVVSNNGPRKNKVSFNVRVPVDEALYNSVAQHHKRKLTSQSIPVVIPHNQSCDLCEITGLSPEEIKQDFEYNKIIRHATNPLEIMEELSYVDPEGYEPVRR